ncbi:DUF2490 domain-containing protein [Saccharicrinis aurantiacus]|uniref:DUF2490 domain-containing protein n=1 Tax=Saccharicrinis aurantiacus TaxID=1849719 RepID=UPI00094F5BE6|nr:DUF2490 domain-containing protein [Saccharicrinis aurantiacus]
MIRKIQLLLCAIIVSINGVAQDSQVTQDLEMWTSVAVQKKVFNNKLSLNLNQQFRFDENSSRLYEYFTRIKADYEIFNNLYLGAGYRFIKTGNSDKGFSTEYRFNTDITYKQKIDRIRLSYRLRYQNRTNAKNKDLSNKKYRFRLKLDYNIKNWKYDPFFASEIFYAKKDYNESYIDEVKDYNTISDFQKIRFQVGTTKKTGKVGVVKIFYMLEYQFADYQASYGNAITTNNIGINYTFKL